MVRVGWPGRRLETKIERLGSAFLARRRATRKKEDKEGARTSSFDDLCATSDLQGVLFPLTMLRKIR
jgi:phosphoglycerate dehydrogenase-like enzyme